MKKINLALKGLTSILGCNKCFDSIPYFMLKGPLFTHFLQYRFIFSIKKSPSVQSKSKTSTIRKTKCYFLITKVHQHLYRPNIHTKYLFRFLFYRPFLLFIACHPLHRSLPFKLEVHKIIGCATLQLIIVTWGIFKNLNGIKCDSKNPALTEWLKWSQVRSTRKEQGKNVGETKEQG